ncbi:MAG: spermidine/putrescine ABC transporter substrate-binding protein [Verrucomicrobiota bacterium JB022]|nr:spermidine/putrescine ABC transporter substrate-binding protein [Verrucomicrobiota bacterium JB022]
MNRPAHAFAWLGWRGIWACFALILFGCGPVYSPEELNRAGQWTHLKLEKRTFPPGTVVRALVWGRYFDEEVIQRFEDFYQIDVQLDTVMTNDEMLKILEEKPGYYDLAMPTGYMVETMRARRLLTTLNPDLLPNAVGIPPTWRELPFDPRAQLSLPYYYGALGFGFDIAYVDGLPTSASIVLSEKNARLFEGMAALPDDARFALGATLVYLGYSANSTNRDEIREAADLLKEFRRQGNIFESDYIVDTMLEGKASLALMWSGDATLAASQMSNIRFLLPDEQVITFFDCFVIPATSQQPELAHFFLNYLLEPTVAGQMSNYSHYMVTNLAARPYVKRTILNGPAALMPPPQRTVMIESVGEMEAFYEEVFAEVKAVEPVSRPASYPPYLPRALKYGRN